MKYLLLGRAGCELCEEAEQALRARFPAAQIEHADVDGREEWQRRYGLRVPVLLDRWNEVVAEGRIDPETLKL